MNKYWLCATLAILNGCFQVGPDYEKPRVDAPPQWRFQIADAQQTADLPWWHQFNDSILNALVEQALTNNLDLKIAIANIEQFRGVYGATRANLFPQLSGQGVYDRRQASAGQTGAANALPDSDFAQLGVSMLWELDIWGQLRRAKQAAYADLLAQQSVRDTVVLTLVSAVVQTYIDLRALDYRLAITRQTVDTLTEENRIARTRLDAGYASEIEVSQSNSELERRRAQIPLYEQQIAQTEHALSLLLGQAPTAVPRGLALADLQAPAVPAGLPSDLLLRRPDIQQAEQNLIAANARIGVARGEYFPKVRLTGDLGQASLEMASLFAPGANFWTIGTRVLGPIFTAGKIAAQVQTAEAAQQAALADYQKAILSSFREFEDALIARAKSEERQTMQNQRVAALKNYLHLSHLRFDEGYTPYLEVLDALRQYYEGQIEWVQANNDSFTATIQLYRAMGGGWLTPKSAGVLKTEQSSVLFPE